MKTCSYCGKQYSDDAEVCALDQQPLKGLAESSAGAAPPKARGVFGRVFAALLLVGNLLLLAVAWHDKTWGAFWIAFIGGPILNGMFLIYGLLAISFLKRDRRQFSLGRHLALTLGLPIAAVVADFFIICLIGQGF
jgi:hypothetical protein